MVSPNKDTPAGFLCARNQSALMAIIAGMHASINAQCVGLKQV